MPGGNCGVVSSTFTVYGEPPEASGFILGSLEQGMVGCTTLGGWGTWEEGSDSSSEDL
jgi:hypothetical protein